MHICPQNQWAADALKDGVKCAARFTAAQMIAAGASAEFIDVGYIQNRILTDWLSHAVPAGNA